MAPPYQRVGLVINPTAGGRRAVAIGEQVTANLTRRKQPFVDLSGPTAVDALAYARDAVSTRQIDALIAVGGDGMVNLAVNAVASTGIPLIIVPAGTGNDLASAVGVPLGDPEAALDLLDTGTIRQIDAARVTNPAGDISWFAGVLAGGFDAIVNERANSMGWPRGSAKYTLAALRELPVFTPIPYRITIDDKSYDARAMLVAVANATSYGGGMKVVPTAQIADGRLDVLILDELSLPTFIRVFPRVFSGGHVTHPAVRIIRGQRVLLEAPDVVAYADGERVGPLPRTIEIVPGALRIHGAAEFAVT